jgi:hypothetical protein
VLREPLAVDGAVMLQALRSKDEVARTYVNPKVFMSTRHAETIWLNKVNEGVFDSGCKRGLSAEADLSTILKTPLRAGSLITM